MVQQNLATAPYTTQHGAHTGALQLSSSAMDRAIRMQYQNADKANRHTLIL